jgi:hypothetical protein
MADTPTLVRFVEGWDEDGIGEDGLPRYRSTVKIIKARPPWYESPPTEPTEKDIEDNADPWRLFQKEQAAKGAQQTATGFPLALWTAITPAALKMLSARDIVTVEQLAKRAGRGADDNMPAELKDLAKRAQQVIDMTKNVGQYEVQIRDLEGQIEVLNEQVIELRNTIKAQDGVINNLKLTVA